MLGNGVLPYFWSKRCLLNLFYTLLLLLTTGLAHGQQPVMLQPGPGKQVTIVGSLETFADSTRQLRLPQIRSLYSQRRFSALPGDRLLKNYTTANHWLHFRVQATNVRLLYLEVANPRINQIDFYQLIDNKLVSQIRTGDSLPFPSRGFPHYNWIFPIQPNAQRPTDVFVSMAKHGEVLNARLQLWTPIAFEQYDRQRYLLWGMLAGFTVLVLLLNGMVWIATADWLYGLFMLVISAHAFHLGAASGLSFQYLWPGSPAINNWYPQTLSAWLIVWVQLHFMQRFIGQTALNSRMFRWVNRFKYSIIAASVLTLLLVLFGAVPPFYFRLLVVLTLLFSLMVIPLAILSLRERIRRREPIILFYAGITTIQFLSLSMFLLNAGLTRLGQPLFEFTNEGLVIVNYLADLVLLSLGVLYFGFTNYRRANEQLLTTLHQQKQAQSGQIIEALEIERNRIAEDLYDDVGAMLSTAIGYVSSVLRKPDVRDTYPLLTEARLLLDRAVENLRTVSHNLMPKNFAQLGLAKSLAETIDKVSATTTISFQYIVAGQERRLDTSLEVQIFRIAVELINDTVANASATQATLQLVYGETSLVLLAENNGSSPPHYTNIQSKVAFIHGTIDVDISPDGVTTIVDIPY